MATEWIEMRVPRVMEHVDGEPVSPALRPLLAAVYVEVQRPTPNLPRLKEALRALLGLLASSEGRTNANCCATDAFFGIDDDWERRWEHLPEDFQDVLSMLGEALHDTVSAPEIAENFHNTPEQLLDRVSQLTTPEQAI